MEYVDGRATLVIVVRSMCGCIKRGGGDGGSANESTISAAATAALIFFLGTADVTSTEGNVGGVGGTRKEGVAALCVGGGPISEHNSATFLSNVAAVPSVSP